MPSPLRSLLLPSPISRPLRPSAWPSAPYSRAASTLTPPSVAALLHRDHDVDHGDRPVTLNGYVRSVRKQKRVAFAALGDGSSLHTVQAVLTPQQAEGLSTGAAVSVTGQWTPSPGKEQSRELHVASLRILGHNDASTYPLQKKYHTPEFLRTLPHLRPRLPFNALLLRLRSYVTAQLTSYLAEHDFVQAHPPIITSSDCEGAGDVFTVTPETPASKPHPDHDFYFASPKYLTVSSQLHLEALAHSVSRVWALSPTFRAEKSDTARHLSEFYMLEAELAFVDRLDDVMDLVESMLRALASGLQSSRVGEELLGAHARDLDDAGARDHDSAAMAPTTLARRWQGLVDGPWPRITYDRAIQLLKHAVAQGVARFDHAPDHKDGLHTEHERYLADAVGQGSPVFVTDYPRNMKPFYMSPSADAADDAREAPTVSCFDLLVPDICELAGGSMREHRLAELSRSMEEHGLHHALTGDAETQPSDASLQWYLDLRRYGSVPHGGFGLGFDRLLCYLSGVSNIRDVVSFPRWYRRCDC